MSEDEEKARAALGRLTRDAELLAKGPGVMLHLLAGWATATLPPEKNGVILVLEYLTGPPTTEARILRLAMSRTQATELSRMLDHLARTPHVKPPGKPS